MAGRGPNASAAAEPRPGAHSRNMMTALVGNGYPAVMAFFTGPILAQALGVDGRGYVAAAAAPFSLITTIAAIGVPEAVRYVVARNGNLARAAAGRGMSILIVAGLISAIGVAFAAPFLSGGTAAVQQLIYITCFAIVPSLLVGVLRGVAAARGRWNVVTLERIVSSTLRLVVLIPFWLTDSLTPLVATLSVAAMPVMGGLVYIGMLRQRDSNMPELPKEARILGLMGYGMRIWIGALSGILLSRLDQTLMTPLAGTFQLGLYVVAVSISELPLIINMAVRDVTFVSEATESKDDRLTASARISTAASAVAATVIGVSMIWWLPFLFGKDFGAAVPVAGILLLAVVLLTPGSVGGSGLSARGKPGLRSWALVVACVVNVVLLVLLAPSLGAVGAAIATLVGNVTASNLNLYFMSRIYGVPARDFYGVRRSDITVLSRFAIRIIRAVFRRPPGRKANST